MVTKKWLWTFGIGTKYKDKCVITHARDYETAMNYVYDKYGQCNVSQGYVDPWHNFEEIIKRNNYEIIEEITL